ncbi:MAG: SRPBCC domain-containing protein [Actinomycetota bacterium]
MTREVTITAPPEAVWVALTDPAELSSWFGAEADVDLRPGGSVRFRWADGVERRGLVIEHDPPHRFAFRWRELRAMGSDLAASDPTVVEFVLEGTGGGTRVRVTESPGIAPDRALSMAEAQP